MGIETSVNYLERENDFWGNEQFKIPLPENLRTFAQDEVADEFIISLNRVAEEALIRQDPLKRTIDLLRKVFGSV